MKTALRRLILAAALCLTAHVPAAMAQLPAVRIATWEQSANGTGVVFKPLVASAVSDGGPALPNETEGGLFEYGLDTSDIKWADECRCFRYYVVTVRSRQSGVVSRHKFRAQPSGSFEDQRVQVRLTISETQPNPNSDADDISLPVASAPGLEPAPLVIVQTRGAIGAVSLGGASEIQIVLRNPSKHVAVQVPSTIVVTSDDNALWSRPPIFEERAFPLTLAPNTSEVLRLHLEPHTWEAIQASLVPSSNDKPHTAVRIRVPYTNTIFQQREGWADLELPIRFRPSIITLVLALAAGVTLGSVIPIFSRRGASFERWSRATVTALAVGIVLELVGIFMVANNSKFVLFSFDIDPWQTLPVLLLGISNGLLGLEAAKRLKVIKDASAS